MNLTACCLIIVTAVAMLLFLPQLPSRGLIGLLLLVSLGLVRCDNRVWQCVALFIWVFCWAVTTAQQQLSQIRALTLRPITTEVTISAVEPLRERVKVRLRRSDQAVLFPVLSAWIYAQEAIQDICPGQRWLMKLQLKPVHSLLNEGGYDSQRNALANGIPLQGRILEKTVLNAACDRRSRVISASEVETDRLTYGGVIRALLFGARDTVPPSVSQLFRLTGIAHLMAISGMHIGLVAGIGWWLLRAVQRVLPRYFLSPALPRVGCMILAGCYTWLSGGQPPALRAMLAMILWFMFRQCFQNVSSWQVWLLCGALLLVSDPLLVLSDSFWLSWLAVLMLLSWYRWFPLPPPYARGRRWHLLQLLHLQAGMLLLMLPLQALLFKGISLSALATNMVAIPLVSLVTLPLSGLALLLLPTGYSGGIWKLADISLQWLVLLLESPPPGWRAVTDFSLWAVLVWGGLAVMRSLLIFRFPGHCLAILLCCLLWRYPVRKELWRVDMLDVGHGLSVVIRQGEEAVIYDTGNRWQTSDAGQRIIIPWLLQQGLRPQQVILSHRHLDHYGGWQSLKAMWPQLSLRTAFATAGSLSCQRGDKWQWRRLNFRVLWPPAGQQGRGNNDSCVISVSDGLFSLLLTGDIERQGEQQLVALEKQRLASTFIQVPHHGSNTSSLPVLLRRVEGQVAIASLARYNAWKMPSPAVINRYRDNGFRWLDTAVSGQITLKIDNNGYQITQLREEIFPRWYHQWFGVKPDYR